MGFSESSTMKVREAIPSEPPTAGFFDSIAQAAQLMQETGSCFLPILSGSRVAGVVTDRDLAVALGVKQVSASEAVGTVMNAQVRSVDAEATLEEAANEIIAHGVHRLVVLDKFGIFVGILAISDLQGRISDARLVHTLRMLSDYNHPQLARRRPRIGAAATLAY